MFLRCNKLVQGSGSLHIDGEDSMQYTSLNDRTYRGALEGTDSDSTYLGRIVDYYIQINHQIQILPIYVGYQTIIYRSTTRFRFYLSRQDSRLLYIDQPPDSDSTYLGRIVDYYIQINHQIQILPIQVGQQTIIYRSTTRFRFYLSRQDSRLLYIDQPPDSEIDKEKQLICTFYTLVKMIGGYNQL